MSFLKKYESPLILSIPFLYLGLIWGLNNIPFIKAAIRPVVVAYLEETVGNQHVSPEIENQVAEIATKMGVKDLIPVRKTNAMLLNLWGYHNALAVSPHYYTSWLVFDIPFLYVSQGFFEDLTFEEQQFLLGHELTHIRDKHAYHVHLLYCFLFLLSLALWWVYVCPLLRRFLYRLFSPQRAENLYPVSTVVAGIFLLGVCKLWQLHETRCNEWRADTASLNTLHSHEGALKLIARWQKERQMPDYFALGGLLMGHIAHGERRAFVKSLQHKKV